ncbi:hypothetical protein PY254_15675 [Rhodanobacter sp. AS-Z3]|uniref:hypothetical protein n=1 Tax=Rhodanobacter sp. AS-Z3 TaxID=3031330 RepID=UPI0024791211|nr:hypothetical protein [Rhodanobacter sp. AS-Z3]WEN14652.1 hypothetical protein PY254_15675 [Rhodanobacter sp. AS-Z3]
MDDVSKSFSIDSTPQLLADRLRRRYVRCRESLATFIPQAPAALMETRTPVLLSVVPGGKAAAPVQVISNASADRFSTLFSQAYSAARQTQSDALSSTLDRVRQRLSA